MKEIDISGTSHDPAALRELLATGEDVFLTKAGKLIARLIPANLRPDALRSREASLRIRERAERLKLGAFNWEEWKSYRDDGRP